ncbi:MAG TPA: alanine--tRNA ligase [Pirellulales bacterium]|jgi:alanyl-tRNA synthetase|nr:alanine--tRNA ligase [Pirellulales bacterium]
MKTDELREKYLAFFETKGCVRRPSDVLVPTWDPSVLFTPAGMNQFKDHFLGKCKLDFTRATTCQKCLRTGDIDNVGRTAYHHTFFEMLGNFSFGDYFKREAINWAWEFLTSKQWLGLPADRLTVSVYQDDDEAAEIWARDIKLSPDRIERMGEDDNFWPAGAPSQGPDGVCGPCSEIFFHPPKGGSVEIWNLVFTQFNRVGKPPNNLRPLPSKNIDTGMGLERTASVLQGADTNYHIDILRPIVEAAAEVTRVKYDPDSDNGRRLRRITDHVRACTFAIHENVYPGNKKQGYVIRRLLRRAVLDGRQMGIREPFLHQLVPRVAEMMRTPYPELGETATSVAQVIEKEEANFFSTIDAGLERIERVFDDMRAALPGRVMVDGREAFDMYTTHGFPPELFETLAAEHNFTFDWDGFRQAMETHEKVSGGGQVKELFKTGPLDAIKKVMDGTKFVGYETMTAEAKIVGLIAQDKLCDHVDEIGHAQPISVVLDRSPFYGESGGQVGDTGELIGKDFRFEVIDTQKEGNFLLHQGHLRSGVIRQGATVTARVNTARRQGIRRAHSATHMLHYALQKHLGAHAKQQGSKVDDDFLRFDFTNPHSLSREQLAAIEVEVNERVAAAEMVSSQTLPIAEARKAGAMMLFGEKYPDLVRMVSMGEFSKELCGGTHLDNTGQVGLFKIVAEESVAAGTRRIAALTGAAALERMRKYESLLGETAATLKSPPEDVPQRVAGLLKEVRELKRRLSAGPRTGTISVDELLGQARQAGETRVIVAEVPGGSADDLRHLIDQLRQKTSSVAALLASREEGKVLLVAGISRDLEGRGVHAGNWIRETAKLVGGSGGGKPGMAQAGGKDPDKLPAALESARRDIDAKLAG